MLEILPLQTSQKTVKALGLPSTRQRSCILKTMRERYDHPDAEMVYETVHKKIPTLSRDTVYRTLALFAQEGLIVQLALPTRRFRYEGQMHEHAHFICTRCEAVLDVDVSSEAPQPIPQALADQAVVAGVQTVYIGTCRHCLDESATGFRNCQLI